MKKTVRFFSLFLLVCLGAVMLTATASAEDGISLKLKRNADSIVLSWSGSKKETYTVYKKAGDGKFTAAEKVTGKKYTDRDLKSGESYTYYVKKGKKLKSGKKSVVYLAAPKMKKASVNEKGITLKWKKAECAESYTVYRKADGGKKKRLGKTQELSFTDTTAEKDVIYTYTVKSTKGKAVSTASELKVGRLSAPKLISLKKSEEGLVLKWEKNPSAEKYSIYRRGDGSKKWKKTATLSAAALSYEDKAAQDGVKYHYYVRAVCGNSTSLYENEALSATCRKAPTDLALEKNGKKIKLKWAKKEGAKSYEIYKKAGNGKWKKLAETKKTSYTDKVKSTKVLLYYKVRAVMGKSKTAFSSAVTSMTADPSTPMVALTYDDGPHPVNTHRILDVLEKHGARATFFVVGSRITAYKDCLERQAALGCEIANHSYSHVTLSVSSDNTVRTEIEKTDALIKKYSGQTPVLCRAPGGSVGKAAVLTDRPFIHWSVDTMDWHSLSSSKVVSHIKKNVRDGSIILMHDLYGSTAAASKIIIPWLISEGYQLVTVSELLEARKGGAEGGKIYYNGYA